MIYIYIFIYLLISVSNLTQLNITIINMKSNHIKIEMIQTVSIKLV